MSFIGNIGQGSIDSLENQFCPPCPSCDTYNGCYCDFMGFEIVNYALADWGKSGYKISAAINQSADESGVTTPWSTK